MDFIDFHRFNVNCIEFNRFWMNFIEFHTFSLFFFVRIPDIALMILFAIVHYLHWVFNTYFDFLWNLRIPYADELSGFAICGILAWLFQYICLFFVRYFCLICWSEEPLQDVLGRTWIRNWPTLLPQATSGGNPSILWTSKRCPP